MTLLIALLCAFGFRVRGGLRLPKIDKKFPLNKWWFAVIFSVCATYLKGWNWNFFFVMLIASRLSTQLAGWGEYCGCALGVGKPNKIRKDFAEVDEFLDTFEFKGWKLIEHPYIFGITGLTIRGVFLTFIIGLALNSIPFMLSGAGMGIIYYLCGLFARKVLKKKDKTGWNLSEWAFGFYLGLILCVIC